MKFYGKNNNIISIGEDKYIFINFGKNEYEYFCNNIRDSEKRAKFYIIVNNIDRIKYLKLLLQHRCVRLRSMKNGRSRVIVNVICSNTMFKKYIRDTLQGYEKYYKLDGSRYFYLTSSNSITIKIKTNEHFIHNSTHEDVTNIEFGYYKEYPTISLPRCKYCIKYCTYF